MKKLLFFIALLFSLPAFSQFCGFDEIMREVEAKNPQLKKERLAHEEAVRKEGIQNVLKRLGYLDKKTGKATNTIYEIPVVVHVIVPNGDEIGTEFNPSDSEIMTWLDNANKIYATTYGNGYYPVTSSNPNIDEPTSGTIMPFKLVLARRDPNCNVTSGIVRYDGSVLSGYDEYGVNKMGSDLGNGVSSSQIRAIAPHWDESAYFNVYIVNKVDGNKKAEGNLGWATGPGALNSNYDTFMKCAVLQPSTLTTFVFVHEMGHAFGLLHPFANGDNDNNVNSICPLNTDCSMNNDFVCDTAPTKSMLVDDGKNPADYIDPYPADNDINECTGNNYGGIQYNIMNYVKFPKKFTPGQRNRAIEQFLNSRNHLANNSAALIPPAGNSIAPPPNNCYPQSSSYNQYEKYLGPRRVILGDIDNNSTAFYVPFQNFYEDWTKNTCLNKNVTTNLKVGNNTIQIYLKKYLQSIRIWLDFNNDGSFSSDEVVATENNILANELTDETIWSKDFVIPNTIVFNTPLRLRIKTDIESSMSDPCTVAEGQIEDYAVTITKPTYTITTSVNPENSGNVSGAGSYSYGDLVTLVAQPKDGYEFINWTQDGQEVSTQIVYTFGAYADRNLVANFRKIYKLGLSVFPANSGVVSGAGNYVPDTVVNISATPSSGYSFVNWTENGAEVSTSPNISITLNSNRNLRANFTNSSNSNTSINQYQYWYDGNYNANTEVHINSVSNLQLYDSFTGTENLSPGLHDVTFRAKDNQGNWSATIREYFVIHSKLNELQYWFDDDFSNPQTLPASGSRDITFITDFPTNNLSFGLHKINLRSLDNAGKWSSVTSSFFYKKPSLEKTEYWFDDNYAGKVELPITNTEDWVYLSSISTNNLGFGLHKINFHTKDNAGKWSSVTSSFFYKKASLEKAEYWIDNSYSNRVSVPISDEVFFFDQSVFVGSLDDKLHTITFRTKDQSGKWSSAISAYFMSKSKIVGYEYWLNEDYNSKNYTTVTPTDFLEESFNVNVYQFNYISGTNILHFRAKNNFGKWSSTIDTEFTMGGTLGVEVIKNEKNILLYPNPFEDFITVQSKNTEILQVALFDTSGKMVKQLQNINKKEYKLEGSNLPSSMYILVVITKDAKQSFKVIKK